MSHHVTAVQLEKNTTLTHLNLSCNNMTSLVSSALRSVIRLVYLGHTMT